MRRRASRFIPKIVRRKTPLWGWFFLAAFFGSLGYLYIHALLQLPLLVVAALVLFLILIASVSLSLDAALRRRLQSLAAARAGESIGTFARFLDYRSIDTWIIRAVYEGLQEYLPDGFPLRPEDRWREDLEIDEEDFEMDLVPEIAQRAGRSLEGAESNPYYGKVQTVGDLVHFLNLQPRSSPGQGAKAD